MLLPETAANFATAAAAAANDERTAFSSRQGQLLSAGSVSQPAPATGASGGQANEPKARLVRQQPAPQQFQRIPQQQQQPALDSFRSGAAQAQPTDPFQPRFQRLRTPPGGNQEQFLSQQNPGLAPLPPLPVPLPPPPPPPSGSSSNAPTASSTGQFGQPTNQRQQQQQANNNGFQFGVPTLSAFDLSSLANLANQQAQFSQQQPQQPFRRLPQQVNNNQQQQQRASNNNPLFDQRQQQQNFLSRNPSPFPSASQTELPFVRQVFRPAQAPQQQPAASELLDLAAQPPAQDGQGSQRPTPPPLFVPGRTINANTNSNSANSNNNSNKITRLVESGFSPMQSNANQPSREVFFEPATNSANRLSANNQQRNQPARPSATGAQSNPTQNQQPARQQPAEQQQQPQQLQQRKPPVRRPSQRPQLPAVNQQQQQLQSDVIRLASSAIQSANEGLAAAFASTPSGPEIPPAQTTTTTTTTQGSSSFVPVTTTAQSTTRDDLAGSSTPASSSSLGLTTVESAAAAATTTSTQAESSSSASSSSGRRATPGSGPLRSSASSFFALTSAATSSPTSFSPALPINAAVAASAAGRRRIPVRGGQQTASSQSRSPTTTPANFFSQPATTTTTTTTPLTTTTTTATATSSTTTAQRNQQNVRRPEIEEFYETIGGNLNGGATTIDGFGAPSRGQVLSSSSSSNSQAPVEQPPTTPSGEFYGSRLSSSSDSSSNQPEANQQPAPKAVEQPAVGSPQQPQQPQQQQQPQPQQQAPVLVPVTYMTTLTYLTTVLHGTHTLETSHESVVKSTELATLNAQLMDQIEHRKPLIEPTATLSLSSRTKGKGTTIVNLKSVVSAFNQELVDALAGQPPPPPSQEQAASLRPTAATQQRQQLRTLELADLESAKKSLLTEYVYSYTIKQQQQPDDQPAATSVRTELVTASADNQQLMQHLQQLASVSAGLAQPIDSNGLLRVNNLDGREEMQLNLGKCCFSHSCNFFSLLSLLSFLVLRSIRSLADRPTGCDFIGQLAAAAAASQ